MRNLTGFLVLAVCGSSLSTASAVQPKAADDRLIVELVAQEPNIVTPTGIAVDELGRIWVVENHTHQRPAKYKGPTSDRIRILEDFGPDGKARKITTWAEGFQNTMSIALGKNGAVYVATRSAIFVLRDKQGKGQADEKQVLVHLDTKTTYPHNGLSGFAFDAQGEIYFGLGENFGASYKLIGSDKTLFGAGEGGNIYRIEPGGSGLTRIATGFWNPFHMAFDRWGRLFAVDNDPDARGPCRLLHIIQDGDYGYRFKYGRKGIHPFQSWNGELPGTLPMVAGTAEAPSGIVAYESDGLPEEFRGLLLVTSWGDHVIEQFQLEPRGASFGAKKKIMVRGDKDFRPVGIAIAPDGSLIVSDWVDQSYPVHGKGRIWRIRMKNPPAGKRLSLAEIRKQDTSKLTALLNDPRREARVAAAHTLATREGAGREVLWQLLKEHNDPLARLHALWALLGPFPNTDHQGYLLAALADSAAEVRAEAAGQWAQVLARQLPFDFSIPKLDFSKFKSSKVKKPPSKMQTLIPKLALEDPAPAVRLRAIQACGYTLNDDTFKPLVPLVGDPDPFIASAAISTLATGAELYSVAQFGEIKSARFRLGVLLRTVRAATQVIFPQYLDDNDPAVRSAAIQWIAEKNLDFYANLIDKAAAKSPVSRELFEAWLAAKELLANPGNIKDANKELGGDAFVLKIVTDAKQPPQFRALALRMLRPDHPKFTLPNLLALAKDTDPALRAEAVKTLAWRGNAAAQKALRELALDDALALSLRGDAVLGLALSASTDPETRQALVNLTTNPVLAADALRSLRGSLPADAAKALKLPAGNDVAEHAMLMQGLTEAEFKLATPRPKNAAEWQQWLITAQGDSVAGERVFFHSKGPRCFACHRIDGRGEAVGPDLSRIGVAMKREKLIESLLEPSKEIAPAFATWLVTMRDGKQHTGIIALESFDSTVAIVDAQGKRTVLKITDIEDRVAQKTSIMPADLHGLMTRREFADLLAFLEERK